MCKGEQIPDQRRPPLCSAQSGVQQTSHAGVDNGARLSHFEVADNRCEQVVKVVRDTTGQLAEGLPFSVLAAIDPRQPFVAPFRPPAVRLSQPAPWSA